jgi:hypothetical protein
MLNKTLIALAALASVALSAAALTPAMANYDSCYENPAAAKCPGNFDASREGFALHPYSNRSAAHEHGRIMHRRG